MNDPLTKRITDHHKRILHWVAMGKSNEEIGTILGISPLTVKNHVLNIARGYGVFGDGGTRLKIVMAALLRGDLNLETFREDYSKCLAIGTLR